LKLLPLSLKDAAMAQALPSLSSHTVHICIDMQRLFSLGGPWSTPWLPKVLPQCVALARHRPEATIFTRFVPPESPDAADGAWVEFYRRWPNTTRERIDPSLLELVPELAGFTPPALVFNKPVYSAFAGRKLVAHLRKVNAATVILTGAETDVCVLSSAMGAVDHGFHVVIATDAVCSFSDSSHDALLDLFKQRFSQQIATAETAHILEEWCE
jgi:nicotinamidase-related amidase